MSTMFTDPYSEERPWGSFEQFTLNELSTVKIITVHAGESLSLQFHNKRAEFWHVLSGEGTLHIGDVIIPIIANTNHSIAPMTPHRITATTADVVILEIATGTFDEHDITRLEDKYGRTS